MRTRSSRTRRHQAAARWAPWLSRCLELMVNAMPSATRARLDMSTLEPEDREAGASLGVTGPQT
eukprot:6151762-Heterocapsa_arctica.AAC.1